MIKCPMCRDLLPDSVRQCRKCQTDLTLLADYVTHLRTGLAQAESCTRAGELGDAVWAYLAVLEVDPDNGTARRQVGKVVTAVRQFDQTAPGRRWMRALHKEGRYRRWLASWQEEGSTSIWSWLMLFLLLVGALLGAYSWGVHIGKQLAAQQNTTEEEDPPPAKPAPPAPRGEKSS
jgi:hypothetical protein